MSKARKLPEAAPDEIAAPIVLNNTNGPRVVPFGGVSDGGVGVIDMERMRFAPGINMPKDPKEFATVRRLPGYQRWLAEGVFTELEDVSEISTVGGAVGAVLEASSSRVSVQWWRKRETRPTAIKLLDAKISDMTRYRTQGDDQK